VYAFVCVRGQQAALLGTSAPGQWGGARARGRDRAPTRAPGRVQVSYKSYWIRAILQVLHAGRGTMMSIQDVSNVTGIHPNDVREAMGTIQLTQCAPRARRHPRPAPPARVHGRPDGDGALRARAPPPCSCGLGVWPLTAVVLVVLQPVTVKLQRQAKPNGRPSGAAHARV